MPGWMVEEKLWAVPGEQRIDHSLMYRREES